MIPTNCRTECAPLAAVRLTSGASGSRPTSGSLAGLRLCMVLHAGIRWRVLRVIRPAGSPGRLGNRPTPRQRVSAKNRSPVTLSASQSVSRGPVWGTTCQCAAFAPVTRRSRSNIREMIRMAITRVTVSGSDGIGESHGHGHLRPCPRPRTDLDPLAPPCPRCSDCSSISRIVGSLTPGRVTHRSAIIKNCGACSSTDSRVLGVSPGSR